MAVGQKCSFGWKMQRAPDPLAVTRFFLLRVGPLATKQPGLISGPFVYRLGHQVFNLGRGVQLPYGLPVFQLFCGAVMRIVASCGSLLQGSASKLRFPLYSPYR
jgi:hypothetical protein